jgi:Asp-tRNA(Asn)/Glu-tRNA(Gln) amidotransferase A subunit family amidase
MVRKRKTEVDGQLGDLTGPLTSLTAELIRAIERGERTCGVANLELLAAYEALEGLFTAVFNVTGALVLPCGRDSRGLPIGLQLSAPPRADLRLLAAASVMQNALAFERRAPAARSSAG